MADCSDCAGRTGDDGYPVRCYHPTNATSASFIASVGSDEIVTRLRRIVPIHEGRKGHDCIAEAADEIERLLAVTTVSQALDQDRRDRNVTDNVTHWVTSTIQTGTADQAIELMNHLRAQALRLDRHLADPRHEWNRIRGN